MSAYMNTPERQAESDRITREWLLANPNAKTHDVGPVRQTPGSPAPAPGGGDYWSQFSPEGQTATNPGAPAPLPPGYEMGTYTGGGNYPLASVMGPGLMQPWTTPFNRPELNESTDPGYAARLAMGAQAIERSASARGLLRTGGLVKDLAQYGQDYGSNEYDKVYGRALGEYQMANNIYNQNQGNQFGRLNDLEPRPECRDWRRQHQSGAGTTGFDHPYR